MSQKSRLNLLLKTSNKNDIALISQRTDICSAIAQPTIFLVINTIAQVIKPLKKEVYFWGKNFSARKRKVRNFRKMRNICDLRKFRVLRKMRNFTKFSARNCTHSQNFS